MATYFGYFIFRKEEVFEVWLNDSEDFMGQNRYVEGVEEKDFNIKIQSFSSELNAKNFIEEKIDQMLYEMAGSVENVEALKTMQAINNISYYIHTQDNRNQNSTNKCNRRLRGSEG